MALSETNIQNDYLHAGTSLQGDNFIIENLLAAGAFGATYLARDYILNRRVVIKEYFPEGCRRSGNHVIPYHLQNAESFEAARDLFLKEAQVLAQFHHSGIVSVYNFFEANNTAYMVMEYLQGPTLSQVLEERGSLRIDEVQEIARQICDALKVVHHAGMLHRDIKPSNAIRCEDGRVVLVDFGLSEKFDDGLSRHTRPLDTALRFGTPGYAPLEQYTHSAQLGRRSDIYALGATLYHLVSGFVPIPATDRACGAELESTHCSHPVFCECILWAMSMDMKKRPNSVEHFWERLQEADATLSARKQLLGVLINRSSQKMAKARAEALKKAEESVIVDDGSCMKIGFIGYLSFWAFIAIVWFIFLFVRYVLVGG